MPRSPRFFLPCAVLACTALLALAAPVRAQKAAHNSTALPRPVLLKSVAVPAKKVHGATKPAKVPRHIDGVLTKPKGANRFPVAVMIDNIPAARPQAGLAKASVVYEALAEGGIPRFMAIFARRDVPLIGPIRSARPYFLRYAAEYPAALVHAGGSPDAQNLLTKLRLVNVEAIRGARAKYFLRRGRYAGLYAYFISGALISKAIPPALDRRTPRYKAWQYGKELTLRKRPRGEHGVAINLGAGRVFDVRYEYNRARNAYLRFTGGLPQRDRNTGEHIAVKNVIVLITPKERVLDRKGRIAINNVGSDKAVLLKDGRAVTVRWVKRSVRGRTTFRHLDGRPVTLNQGPTWITVVPRGHGFRVF